MHVRSSFAAALCVFALAACSHSAVPQSESAEVSSDGVLMRDGIALLQKDGEVTRLTEDITFSNGGKIQANGMVTLSGGITLMLPEGMMVTMDGQLRLQEVDVRLPMPVGAADPASVPASAPASVPAIAPVAAPTPVPSSAERMEQSEASYIPYAEGVLTNGQTKVLFFHAAWCPECKKADALLKQWFPSDAFSRSIYAVDYDTAKDLKVRYGVTYQHTFVVVDGSGKKISSIQGPTETQMKALLK
ncbi:hypothetical protein FJZ27_01590 [Candidatus Peribacteria bacterium]|nr:hypothetical protein [Candidatus Peribacteria bacterium]